MSKIIIPLNQLALEPVLLLNELHIINEKIPNLFSILSETPYIQLISHIMEIKTPLAVITSYKKNNSGHIVFVPVSNDGLTTDESIFKTNIPDYFFNSYLGYYLNVIERKEVFLYDYKIEPLQKYIENLGAKLHCEYKSHNLYKIIKEEYDKWVYSTIPIYSEDCSQEQEYLAVE